MRVKCDRCDSMSAHVEELKEKLARAERIIKKFSVYGTTDCENNNNGYMSRECSGRVTLFIANTKCMGCDPQSYRDDALEKKGDGG